MDQKITLAQDKNAETDLSDYMPMSSTEEHPDMGGVPLSGEKPKYSAHTRRIKARAALIGKKGLTKTEQITQLKKARHHIDEAILLLIKENGGKDDTL